MWHEKRPQFRLRTREKWKQRLIGAAFGAASILLAFGLINVLHARNDIAYEITAPSRLSADYSTYAMPVPSDKNVLHARSNVKYELPGPSKV